jgi:hypothetical protein
MPSKVVNAGQVIDKTLFLTKPANFYRAGEINTKNPKPVSNKLPIGYGFKVDSYLDAKPDKNRDFFYWTFYGKDKKYYAIRHDPSGFSFDALKQQGVKTVEEQKKEEIEENKTVAEKATETITDLATGAGKTVKNLLYIGVGIFAVGYLLPKFINK